MRVIHIGFPKTATTFLQTHWFSQLPERFGYRGGADCADIFRPVTDYDDTIFSLDEVARSISAATGGLASILLSYEPLTGAHYRLAFVNRSIIARRLRALGFDRVIITIRNQFDALESAYKQYIKSGGVLRFHDYVNFDANRTSYLYPQYFDYSSIFNLYADSFGVQNVLVLQYEQLGSSTFSGDLSRFLEIRPVETESTDTVNRSLSRRNTVFLRWLNHLTYSDYHPSHLLSRRISSSLMHRLLSAIPQMGARQSFLDQNTRERIEACFGESNRRLQVAAQITLTRDYPGIDALRESH